MESAHLEYYAQLCFFHLEKDAIELEKITKRMTAMLWCCWLRGIKHLPDKKKKKFRSIQLRKDMTKDERDKKL